MQISQESTCVGVFFNEIAGPQNCNFIKKRLQDNSFEFCELFKNTYFVKDLWTAGSETLVYLFNSFFYGTSPVTASESFRFPTCNFIKKETQTQFLWILWIIQEHLFRTGSMSGWFWNTSAPFQEQLFYRTSPVAASESFRFPACNVIKKRLQYNSCDFVNYSRTPIL